MKRQMLALFLTLCVLLAALPTAAVAAIRMPMNAGVPVWTEETVKEYAMDYIQGVDLEKTWGYYDLQIRRYMPMETYQGMLSEISWMTGEFIEFGTYTSFEEPLRGTKTHVLHLCMEKQDLDMYFTHKAKENDWEVMALDFIPAEKQSISDGRDMLVGEDEEGGQASSLKNPPNYTQIEVVVGAAPYELKGILTMPKDVSVKVPACVLVHDSGPNDMDHTLGSTKLFADIADEFSKRGIAVLRYDKRTFSYGQRMSEEEIADMTVEEEIIQDAIAAGKLLQDQENVDPQKVILLGYGVGAMLAPRIATEANGVFSAMIMVAGTPKSLAQIMLVQNEVAIAQMDQAQQKTMYDQLASARGDVAALPKMSAEDAKKLTLFGINGYYFWEAEQYDQLKMIRNLKLPTYIVQGREDFQISVDQGVEAYDDMLGDKIRFVRYRVYRGLNHLLMKYAGGGSGKGAAQDYSLALKMDAAAARDMVMWIQQRWSYEEEIE